MLSVPATPDKRGAGFKTKHTIIEGAELRKLGPEVVNKAAVSAEVVDTEFGQGGEGSKVDSGGRD